MCRETNNHSKHDSLMIGLWNGCSFRFLKLSEKLGGNTLCAAAQSDVSNSRADVVTQMVAWFHFQVLHGKNKLLLRALNSKWLVFPWYKFMFSLLLVEQLSVGIRSVVNFVVSAAEPSPLQTLRDVCQHTYHKAWAAVLQLLIIVVIYVKDSKQSLLHLFFF